MLWGQTASNKRDGNNVKKKRTYRKQQTRKYLQNNPIITAAHSSQNINEIESSTKPIKKSRESYSADEASERTHIRSVYISFKLTAPCDIIHFVQTLRHTQTHTHTHANKRSNCNQIIGFGCMLTATSAPNWKCNMCLHKLQHCYSYRRRWTNTQSQNVA